MSDFLQLDEKTLYDAKAVAVCGTKSVGLSRVCRRNVRADRYLDSSDRYLRSRWSSWPHEGFACVHCWNSGLSCSPVCVWLIGGVKKYQNE